jgi:hypothetical protein
MALVEAGFIPFEETDVHSTSAIRENLFRLAVLDMPGFVIRDVDTNAHYAYWRFSDVCNDIFHYKGDDGIEYKFESTAKKGTDRPVHLDVHDMSGRAQLNIHTVQEGVLTVRALRMQPQIAQLIANGTDPHEFRFGGKTTPGGRLMVDDELVIPTAYTADLHAGDALLFADSRFPHQFRSKEKPRRSTAMMFHPVLNPKVRRSKVWQRIKAAALVDPYALIFSDTTFDLDLDPEVRYQKQA